MTCFAEFWEYHAYTATFSNWLQEKMYFLVHQWLVIQPDVWHVHFEVVSILNILQAFYVFKTTVFD